MSVQQTPAWVPTIDFGMRLLLARRELDLTVKEAAARCGLRYSTWSTWETKGRKPANMARVVEQIHDGLGVSREWLMWGQASPEPDGPGNADGGVVVRHQGLEPRTRWFDAFRPDLHRHYDDDLVAVA